MDLTAAIALAPQIISLIGMGIGDITSLVNYISSLRAAAQQTKQWTPELDAQFLEALLTSSKTKQWTPDVQLPSATKTP